VQGAPDGEPIYFSQLRNFFSFNIEDKDVAGVIRRQDPGTRRTRVVSVGI
jgi:hypothetical protein